ncbi:MAG: lysophospholipid acyltransferase family protein, partial [Acidobacteriota bacterium]
VSGLDRLPARGPVILAANHSSYLDPALIGRACPRMVHFLVKRSVYFAPGLHWFFRGMAAIPVPVEPSDTSALRQALRLLARGEVVGIFPEGGRSPDGSLGEAKVGATLLAARSGAPLLPVGIHGAHGAMPTGAVFPRPRRVGVVFGSPFTVDRCRGAEARRQMDAMGQRLMREIGRLLECSAQLPRLRARV